MPDNDNLFRALGADEIQALGPMPADEGESPTTDRDARTPSLTAEVHSPGIARQPPVSADDGPFPPPRSMSEGD